jgi:LPXTG-motif cell wall-anchored protein
LRILLAFVLSAFGVSLAGAPVYAVERPPGACAAYAYAGTDITLCDRFAGEKDVDCTDVKHPVKLLGGAGNDPWRLSIGGSATVGCEDQKGYNPRETPDNGETPGEQTSKKPVASGVKEELPKTGPALTLFGIGSATVLLGLGAAWFYRNRRTSFEA